MKSILAALLIAGPASAATLQFRIANPTFSDPSACFDPSFASNPAAAFVINLDVLSITGNKIGTGQGCAAFVSFTPGTIGLTILDGPQICRFAGGSITIQATVRQFGPPQSANFVELQDGIVTGGTGIYRDATGTFFGHGPVFFTPGVGFDPDQTFEINLSH